MSLWPVFLALEQGYTFWTFRACMKDAITLHGWRWYYSVIKMSTVWHCMGEGYSRCDWDLYVWHWMSERDVLSDWCLYFITLHRWRWFTLWLRSLMYGTARVKVTYSVIGISTVRHCTGEGDSLCDWDPFSQCYHDILRTVNQEILAEI